LKPNFKFRLSQDIGIDLGTATCLVYVKDKGIVVSEPSVVAVDNETDEILYDGEEAKRMLGKAPANISVIRPLRQGVISQYDMTLKMLKRYIAKARKFSLLSPRVVVCVPSEISEVEERSVVEAAKNAGARKVYLIEEPVAAAIGAGVDISDAKGSMVVDIGGGTTDIAVISLDNVVVSQSIKVAGDQFNDAIRDYVRRKYNLLIGDLTAEDIKIKIGNVYRQQTPERYKVKGRCLAEGIPREIVLSSTEMLEAMINPLSAIIDAICEVIERTPPDLISDIMSSGIILTGGGALLRGFDMLITEVTNIRAKVAKNPVNCVAIGTGMSLDKINSFNEANVNLSFMRQPKY